MKIPVPVHVPLQTALIKTGIISTMDGLEYEKYCAQWLQRHGYHHVELTRATGDQGIDILASRHGKSYGFQCKYYERPVGNEAVQQAYTGAAYYGCDIPAVITNSTFTRSALQLAEQTDVILIDGADPRKQRRYLSLTQVLSILCTLAGIRIFARYNRHPFNGSFSFQIWSAIILTGGGLCGLYGFHMSFCLLAILLDSAYLVMDIPVLTDVQNRLPVLFWCLVLILDGMLAVRFIGMLHERNLRNSKQIRNELRQEINDSVWKMGQKLEPLLADELKCTVTLEKASHRPDGTSALMYRCSRSIQEDIPLLEYSLNQYAGHDHTKDRYSLVIENPRVFTIVISRTN